MSVSKARRAELQDELLSTMRRLDALKVELHDAQAENRQQVKLHQKKLAELRDILEGREGDQVLLPGTEAGTVKPPKKLSPTRPPAEKPTAPTARQTASGITWTAEDDDSRTGRSRSQARVYRVSAIRVTATGKLNWGWHLPGSALHHGGSSGYDAAPQAMAAAERHELHYWPREKKADRPIVTKNAGPYRPKGEITRWIADERARRVPTFVIEQTGLKTKKAIVAKYGERAVFEKGKPCPKPAERKSSLLAGPLKPLPKAKAAQKRATRRGALLTAKPQWEKLNGEYIDQHPDTGLVLVPGPGDVWELRGRQGTERVSTLIGPIRNLTRALVCTYGELHDLAEKGAAADLPRLTADDVKDELCLDCGIAAGKPSPGCEGCDHPDESKGKKGRPKGAPQDDCAKCGAPSYALVDGQPTCHPCYEKVAKGSAA